MTSLLVGDLHFTALPRDQYRWRIFPRLHKELKKHKPDHLILLGDLTDAKDRHSGELVNRIANEISGLRPLVEAVHIVRGNHDGIDPAWPYFYFLGHLPNVHFYASPSPLVGGDGKSLVLPHSRDPLKDWKSIDWPKYKVVFAHITVRGAESESGSELESQLGTDYFKKRNVVVFSGDVHVAQQMNPVVYVGAPYPIRFGDKFQPRFVLQQGGGSFISIGVEPILRRHMLDITDAGQMLEAAVWSGGLGLGCQAGDQVKVRLHLTETVLHEWQKQRRQIIGYCKKHELDLISVEVVKEQESGKRSIPQKIQARSVQATFEDYVRRQKIDDKTAAVGEELLR